MTLEVKDAAVREREVNGAVVIEREVDEGNWEPEGCPIVMVVSK